MFAIYFSFGYNMCRRYVSWYNIKYVTICRLSTKFAVQTSWGIIDTIHAAYVCMDAFVYLQFIMSYALYPVHCTLCTVSCALYPVSCTLYPVHCTLCTVLCTLYPVPCILYPVSCTLYPVHCNLYPVYCTLCTVSYILYPVSCILSLWIKEYWCRS